MGPDPRGRGTKMKITLNNIPGQIVEIRRSLPDIGLGPSTATVGYKFVADPLPVVAQEFKFEHDGNAIYGGRKVKMYKAFRRDGGSWRYDGSFSTPSRSPRKDLGKIYAELQH